MAFVQIENVGNVGLVQDWPDHNTPPEAWTEAANVRFADGKVQKIQGEEDVFDTPSVGPHFLMPWRVTADYRWIYADGTDIYYTDGSSSTYVTRYTTTPGDDDYTGGSRPIWTGGILHGIPIMNHNNESDYPQQWDTANSRFKDLDNWPANFYAQVVRPFKNFLVALDITESGNRDPFIVKWGHPADPGTVPSSWDPTDATKLAGVFPISQTGGFLMDCMPLFGTNMLYKSDAIWGMTPTGGLDVFRFGPLVTTEGMLAARCGSVYKNGHFIVGQNDIYLFDGRNPQSLVDKRLRKWFFNSIDATHYDKTIVVPNLPKQEIWICFVEAGNPTGYLNKALIWKWTNNTWTIKDLPDTAFLAYGQVDDDPDTFNASSGSFDTDLGAFGSAGISPAELQLLHGKVSGTFAFIHGDEGYQSQGSDYLSYVERTGLAVVGTDRNGNPQSDPSKRKFLRAIYPKIESSVGVTLKIRAGAQETPGGPVTWSAPQTFNSETDTYVGFAVNGKYLAVRFEDDGQEPWELSGYTLDLDVIGIL